MLILYKSVYDIKVVNKGLSDDDYCNVIVVDVAVDVVSHQVLCYACHATGHYICDIPLTANNFLSCILK